MRLLLLVSGIIRTHDRRINVRRLCSDELISDDRSDRSLWKEELIVDDLPDHSLTKVRHVILQTVRTIRQQLQKIDKAYYYVCEDSTYVLQ
jgi:hypothetical protein